MLKIAIIGSGFGEYGLLPAFALTKNCRVTSICAKKSERLLKLCKQFKVNKIYANWQAMLEQEEIDAIAIAVIPEAQYKIAKYAIKKGLNVFAEKPLAVSVKQASELSKLAKKYKVVTAVDFIFPEIPEWIKVKELLTRKTYGKLLSISASWDFLSYDIRNGISSWKTDSSRGGGALAFYFSHVLYYLEFFAGQISLVKSLLTYSKKSKNGGEVGVDLLFRTKNGVNGNARLNCNASGIKRHSLIFICERGTLVLENTKNVVKDFNLSIHENHKSFSFKVKKKDVPKNFDERVGAVKRIAQRFVSGCLENRQIQPSMEEGLRVQKLIQEIKKNARIKVSL